MANKSVKSDKAVINPMFFIPEGVDELEYQEESSFSSEIDDSGDIAVDDYSQDFSNTPASPDILDVYSQVIRTAPGGQQVVDVTLDVEDIPGYPQYEIRAVKV